MKFLFVLCLICFAFGQDSLYDTKCIKNGKECESDVKTKCVIEGDLAEGKCKCDADKHFVEKKRKWSNFMCLWYC